MNTPDDLLKLLGNNLRMLRRKNNLSQMAFAEKTEKSQTFINNIENGKKWISVETLSTFCRVLKVPPHEFFITEDIRNEKNALNILSKHKQFIEHIREMFTKYGEETE
ncbi:MAG TPA: helix-turn-helix transcriptional regulator [Treponemataceae bacterium]|nr:helix-turn-helix transcriptional regulator [Treponemataceae bacterium]